MRISRANRRWAGFIRTSEIRPATGRGVSMAGDRNMWNFTASIRLPWGGLLRAGRELLEAAEPVQSARVDGFPRPRHDGGKVGQIVQSIEARREDLAANVEVPHISAGVVPAGDIRALGVQRPGILAELVTLDVYFPLAGEQRAVPRIAGGQDAIEEVDPLGDELQHLRGNADSHDISRRGRRKMGHG